MNIRTDGIYLFHHEGISQFGKPFKMTMILTFNDHKRVFKFEDEGTLEFTKDEIKQILETVRDLQDVHSHCAVTEITGSKLSLQFINSSKNIEEYSGIMSENGLCLKFDMHYWDNRINDMNVKTPFEEMNFKFIRAN